MCQRLLGLRCFINISKVDKYRCAFCVPRSINKSGTVATKATFVPATLSGIARAIFQYLPSSMEKGGEGVGEGSEADAAELERWCKRVFIFVDRQGAAC